MIAMLDCGRILWEKRAVLIRVCGTRAVKFTVNVKPFTELDKIPSQARARNMIEVIFGGDCSTS